MQNVDPYKRENPLSALISFEAIVAVLCMLVFWQTIARYEASSTDQTIEIAVSPAIVDQANAMEPAILANQGRYEDAIKMCNALLAKKNHDTMVNLCAGNVFVSAGLKDDGLKYLKNAVALSHRNRFVLEDYAEKLAECGHNDEAIAQFESLARLDPSWLKPHLELSKLYMDANRPADAAAQLKFVCQANDRDFHARKLRAIALARAGNVKQGLEEYVVACAAEQQSGVPEALKSLLGNAGIQAADRVVYELQQQVDQHPDEYVPKLRLAQLDVYRNQPSDARDLLQDARHLQPNNVEIQRTLALVLKQLGEDNAAISAFALSVKLEQQQQKQAQQSANQ